MQHPETITVQTENGPVVVNKDDAHLWETKPKQEEKPKRNYTRREKAE